MWCVCCCYFLLHLYPTWVRSVELEKSRSLSPDEHVHLGLEELTGISTTSGISPSRIREGDSPGSPTQPPCQHLYTRPLTAEVPGWASASRLTMPTCRSVPRPMPACLSICLPIFLPACLTGCMSFACLPFASLSACLPVYLHAWLTTWMHGCILIPVA